MRATPWSPARVGRLAVTLSLLATPFLAVGSGGGPGPVRPGDDLVGLWGGELTAGPQVRGQITLLRDREAWLARAAGFEIRAPLAGDSVHVAFPGGQGELRVAVEEGGATLRGFWIQPPGTFTGAAYATPVRLRRVGDDVWSGVIAPLEDR